MASVKVYSTPTCPYCRQAKDYLTSRGVEFTDLNVATDDAARSEMVKKSGQMGVPVIEWDGNIIVGFNRARLDQLIGASVQS